MSDSEKTSFLADNAALFEGPDGQKLLEAKLMYRPNI